MPYEINLHEVPQNKERGLYLPENHLADLRSCCAAADPDVVTDRAVWKKHLLADGYSKVNLRQFARIKDQTGPSCTSNAWTGATEALYRFAGFDCPTLSAASLFAFVGSFRGSSIQDNQRRMLEVGCVPESMWPSSQISGRAPAGFETEAAKWKLKTVEFVSGFDAGTWALLRGRPVVFGVNWGGGGHCIWACRVYWHAAKGWGWEIANSWGADYGDNGFGILYESQIAAGIRNRYGAAAPLIPTYME
jgi:hypothetical protein